MKKFTDKFIAMFTGEKKRTNIVGAIIAVATIVGGIRTLTSYIERKKKTKK